MRLGNFDNFDRINEGTQSLRDDTLEAVVNAIAASLFSDKRLEKAGIKFIGKYPIHHAEIIENVFDFTYEGETYKVIIDRKR
jgi:hypothetical protein